MLARLLSPPLANAAVAHSLGWSERARKHQLARPAGPVEFRGIIESENQCPAKFPLCWLARLGRTSELAGQSSEAAGWLRARLAGSQRACVCALASAALAAQHNIAQT